VSSTISEGHKKGTEAKFRGHVPPSAVPGNSLYNFTISKIRVGQGNECPPLSFLYTSNNTSYHLIKSNQPYIPQPVLRFWQFYWCAIYLETNTYFRSVFLDLYHSIREIRGFYWRSVWCVAWVRVLNQIHFSSQF